MNTFVRHQDGNINLVDTMDLWSAQDKLSHHYGIDYSAARRYLEDIESFRPIESRQCAAVAIATALYLFRVR